HVRVLVLGRELRRARGLRRAVHPVDRLAYNTHCAPASWLSTATTVRCASSILNSLPLRPTAGANSAAAARRNVSAVAGAPRGTSSAASARHGFGATPPSASRTSATVPSSTLSAAATDTSANAYDARSRTLR